MTVLDRQRMFEDRQRGTILGRWVARALGMDDDYSDTSMVALDQVAACDDREIYTTHDERGDYYGDKIFVTATGGIGFNVGGNCIVKPLRDWYALAAPQILFARNPREE